MDIDEYRRVISEVVDIEIRDSSIVESRKTLLHLQERREILLSMKSKIDKDIRQVEVDYLVRRTNIREEFSPENVGSSKMKKFFNNSRSPATMRAKAMKHLESERETKIDLYKDLKFTIDDLIEQIEDIMVEVYGSMKSFLGHSKKAEKVTEYQSK